MPKFIFTTVAISILLIAGGCTPSNQTVQQQQRCAAGDQHPWCMQSAQTNPETQEENAPYPRYPNVPMSVSPGRPPTVSIGH